MVAIREYQPLLEQWGEFELEGGIHLRARFTVTLVEAPHDKETQIGHMRVNTILEVRTPERMHGEPTPGPVDLSKVEILETFDQYKTHREALSIYLLEGGQLIRVRYKPKVVKKTAAFNQNRDPIFLVEANTELVVDPGWDEMRVEAAKERVARPKRAS